ncbi:MAG: nuclear transport factor 2 family protein [Dehalococcoidia bacterium]
MSDDYKAVVKRYFERINSSDPDLLDVFADDVKYEVPGEMPVSGTYYGKDQIMGMWLSFFERLDYIRIHPEEMVAEGETVVVRARGEAMTKEGEEYNNLYVFFFRFRDGKVFEVLEFPDTAYAETVAFGARLVREI